MNKTRNSNIELLRIICMLFILIQHADFWLMGYPQEHTLRAFGACTIEGATIIAVNVFVLISGYFGIKFKGIKILNLLFQCIFAILPLSIVALLMNKDYTLAHHTLYELLFPFNYWFVTAYIGLIIISPVLNVYIDHIDKKGLATTIFLLTLSAFIFDAIIQEDIGIGFIGGYSTIWMINLYFIGRFIRLYSLQEKNLKSKAIGVFCLYVLLQGTLLFFHLTGTRYTSPLVLIGSIAFFLPFTCLNFKSKAINWIANSALMVYLLSMHPLVISVIGNLLHKFNADNPLYIFLPLATLMIVLIFMGAILCDKIRIIVWKWIEPSCRSLVKYTYKLFEKIYTVC